MSSIERAEGATRTPAEQESIEAAAARFFDEVLVPLATRLRGEGVSLADVAPRRASESFYEVVPAFTRADFEVVSGGDPDTLRMALLRQWKAEPALHALADQLARLSSKVGVEHEQSHEVSPLLYVMY